MLGLFALAGVVVGMLLMVVVWATVPKVAQIQARRAKAEELQGKIAHLNHRGGSRNIRRCAERDTQLCVEVNAGGKMFRDGNDFFIVAKTR